MIPIARDDEGCDELDDEIARAIALASSFAKTEEQRAQIASISETVAACDYGDTAALPDQVVPSPDR